MGTFDSPGLPPWGIFNFFIRGTSPRGGDRFEHPRLAGGGGAKYLDASYDARGEALGQFYPHTYRGHKEGRKMGSTTLATTGVSHPHVSEVAHTTVNETPG